MINIEISEERITALVEQEIAEQIYKQYSYESRDAKYGVRTGVDKAVKQYIYDKKDAIVERVIARATVEIVKKGLPKLIEQSFTGGEK